MYFQAKGRGRAAGPGSAQMGPNSLTDSRPGWAGLDSKKVDPARPGHFSENIIFFYNLDTISRAQFLEKMPILF